MHNIRARARDASTTRRARRFSVVKTYCGHGIGDLFHCAPNIPHYAHNKAVGVMKVRRLGVSVLRFCRARPRLAAAYCWLEQQRT